MKKTISLMLAVLMLVVVLSACGEAEIKSDDKNLTASVTAQDAETSSDSETDATSSDSELDTTASENKKNESNSKNSKTDGKSDKKKDGKSDKKGDTGSSKISSTTSTTSTTTTLPEEPVINELPGVKLTSNVGFNKKLNAPEFDFRGKILIARTYEEFKEIYDNDVGKSFDKFEYFHLKEEDNYILKYDEDFFQENALIAVFSYEPSGTNQVKIDGVSKKDGELFVGVISEVPGPYELGTCDIGCWRTLIEVKKSDIADITKITRIKSKAWR